MAPQSPRSPSSGSGKPPTPRQSKQQREKQKELTERESQFDLRCVGVALRPYAAVFDPGSRSFLEQSVDAQTHLDEWIKSARCLLFALLCFPCRFVCLMGARVLFLCCSSNFNHLPFSLLSSCSYLFRPYPPLPLPPPQPRAQRHIAAPCVTALCAPVVRGTDRVPQRHTDRQIQRQWWGTTLPAREKYVAAVVLFC